MFTNFAIVLKGPTLYESAMNTDDCRIPIGSWRSILNNLKTVVLTYLTCTNCGGMDLQQPTLCSITLSQRVLCFIWDLWAKRLWKDERSAKNHHSGVRNCRFVSLKNDSNSACISSGTLGDLTTCICPEDIWNRIIWYILLHRSIYGVIHAKKRKDEGTDISYMQE